MRGALTNISRRRDMLNMDNEDENYQKMQKMLLQEYQEDYIERQEPHQEHTNLERLRKVSASKVYEIKRFENDKARQKIYGTWGYCIVQLPEVTLPLVYS